MEVIIIAAISENNVIGKEGKLPWHIPEDLKRFKHLTMDHPIVMGRRTFESIGQPLPGRKNIVITHNRNYTAEGVLVVHSFEEVLKHNFPKIFVIGGFSLFKEALQFADRLELTRVHRKVEGDVFFPEVDWGEWEELERHDKREYSFITYARK
jgi:dihydrofolate reductase